MRRTTLGGAAAVLPALVLWSACAPRDHDAEGAAQPAVTREDALVSTLEVEESGGVVRLVLHVTNASSAPVDLQFSTGQRYDFVVERADGAEVWRWSSDRMFTQALGSETVAPGQSLRYEATWQPAGETGDFVATGVVTALRHPVRQTARFTLGG